MTEMIADRVAHAVGAQHVLSDGARVRVQPGAPAELADVVRVAGELGAVVGVGVATGIALELSRMHNVLDLDETSLLCQAQAGITVEALEATLNERGLSLGPLPQPSRARTIGALLAAPRPSEAQPRIGAFVNACAGVAAILPDGTEVTTRVAPRKATGPDLMHAILGARGTLGLITSATLRVHRRQETRTDAAWKFASPAAALGVARAALVRGARPLDVAVDARGVLRVSLDGPEALCDAERALLESLAHAAGGENVPHAPPPRAPMPPPMRPWERALAMESLDGSVFAPALAGEAQRVVGWHVGGAALVDFGRPPSLPPPSPLVMLLKQRLDPDRRFPAWPTN